jgi:hypothetical protein
VTESFEGDGLVGVGETESDRGGAPGLSMAGVGFTMGDIDGDLTTLGATFFILTAFIFRALLDA